MKSVNAFDLLRGPAACELQLRNLRRKTRSSCSSGAHLRASARIAKACHTHQRRLVMIEAYQKQLHASNLSSTLALPQQCGQGAWLMIAWFYANRPPGQLPRSVRSSCRSQAGRYIVGFEKAKGLRAKRTQFVRLPPLWLTSNNLGPDCVS